MFQNIFIVSGSTVIYALTDYIYHRFINPADAYHPLNAIGMILPMALLTNLLSYVFSKLLYQYILEIINGISRISDGEFQVKLDERNGGPLKDIYRKFNRMSDELSGIDTLRNDFVNHFSHEFKTPLSSINGFSQLLLEGNCTPEEARRYLTIIVKESERLTALTESQLLLSRLDSQTIVIEKEEYALDEQIRQCIIQLSPEWTKKELLLTIELTPMRYFGNADLMQQVWLNLLSNAIKYTPKGGEISVTSGRIRDGVSVSIRDNGIGMSAEELSHIFGKYYRSDNVSEIKGLGLGLPISKRIVDICQGTIEVESAPGTGSCFTVTLPESNPPSPSGKHRASRG